MKQPENISTHLVSSLEKKLRAAASEQIIELEKNHTPTEILFGLAQEKVEQIWQELVAPTLEELSFLWGNIYQDSNLLDQKLLHTLIAQRHLLELQYLEQESPEVWLVLIKLSMLRQDLEITIMQDIAHRSKRPILVLAADLAAQLGPLFNQAYLQQTELYHNHAHIFKERGSHKAGAEHVYELQTNKPHLTKKVAFKTMIPAWEEIGAQFEQLSSRVKNEFASDGAQFALYLKLLSKLFASDETNTRVLHKLWQKAEKMQNKLNTSHWPLNLIVTRHPYNNGGLNKFEANFTLDIKTRETKRKATSYQPYFHTARKLVKKHHLRSKITPPQIGFLLYGSGHNVFWPNQGEAGNTAQAYSNHLHDEAALKSDLTETLALFTADHTNLSLEEYKELSLLSIYLHELSHTILSTENKKVAKRIGVYDTCMETLEELKAETTSARIFYLTNEHHRQPAQLQKFLQFFIATHHIDPTQLSDGSGYQICSEILINSLLKSKAITKTNDKYQIVDVDRAFQTLIQLSTEIMSLYDDKKTTPTTLNEYVKNLKQNSSPFHPLQNALP
jgi:hypothetical protein